MHLGCCHSLLHYARNCKNANLESTNTREMDEKRLHLKGILTRPSIAACFSMFSGKRPEFSKFSGSTFHRGKALPKSFALAEISVASVCHVVNSAWSPCLDPLQNALDTPVPVCWIVAVCAGCFERVPDVSASPLLCASSAVHILRRCSNANVTILILLAILGLLTWWGV